MPTILHRCTHFWTYAEPAPGSARIDPTTACPACRASAQGRTPHEAQAAAAWARAVGLPTLQGSVAQCAWGETIRKQAMTAVQHALAEQERAPSPKTQTAVRWLRQQAAAGWWIAHRELAARELMKTAKHACFTHLLGVPDQAPPTRESGVVPPAAEGEAEDWGKQGDW